MIAPSERAFRALEALGGRAPVELVVAHVRFRDPRGPHLHPELAIGLAVVAGRARRVEREDGRPGLELLERPEAPA